MRRIQIAAPAIGDEEWAAVRQPLESGWLTQGPHVEAFEKEFALRHGVRHAIATTSATTGLHLALTALGIGSGDQVIVPAFTWVATANAVVYTGAEPVFADIEHASFNVDPHDVARRITRRTRAVIPVHLFGLCADVDALRDVIPPNVAIVEDAACAAGATFDDRPAGSLGIAGIFSFHPRKIITTGEGGMITTNDEGLAESMRIMRNHGASISEEQRHVGPQPYVLPDFDVVGFNYRMTDLQAAVGQVQLRKLDQFIREREAMVEFYRRELASVDWMQLPKKAPVGRHSWQAFVTYVEPERAPIPRNEAMQTLKTQGIDTRPGTHAVHMLGYYRNRFSLDADQYPVARDCANNSMALPLHNRMSEADCAYVVDAIKSLSGG